MNTLKKHNWYESKYPIVNQTVDNILKLIEITIDKNRHKLLSKMIENLIINKTQALEDIVDPLSKMRRELEPNTQLNGQMAVHLMNDPEYLRQIAKEALKDNNYE